MKLDRILSGNRISIRNYAKSDLKFCTRLWFDSENGKYMSDPTMEYVDDVYQDALNSLEESPYGYYFIVQFKDNGEPLGSCCVFPDDLKCTYDVGYCIAQEYWNQGYGTEVVNLLVDWIRSLGATTITAEVAMENSASNALMKRCGFTVAKESEFKKYNMDVKFKSYIYQLNLDQ